MDFAVKSQVFSQFDTTKTNVINRSAKEAPAADSSIEVQTKKGKGKHKTLKTLLGCSLFGMLHGIYKKRDPKITPITISADGAIVKALPANEDEMKLGVKKFIAEKGNKGWAPVGFFDIVKEADRMKCTQMPVCVDDIVQVCDTKNFCRSSRLNLKEHVPYGTFSRVLNPYDERFFKAFGKIPFCDRIANIMSNTHSPIKELNIGKRKLYYNLPSMIKGAAFAAWMGFYALLTAAIVKGVHKKMQAKNQEKIENTSVK